MDIRTVGRTKSERSIPQMHAGDEVRVHVKVVEGDRERTQVFSGVVIRFRRGGANSTFTVRRVSYSVGVERTFHLHSPRVEKLEIVKYGKVARAKLYYLRELVGKKGRIKEQLRPRGVAELAVEAEQPEPTESEPLAPAEVQPAP